MLKMFSRYDFQKAVDETGTEIHARGFGSWNHFVAMLFGQLAGQDSLRGIEAGLASQSQGLYHLGITPVHRSTLAYANEHRSHELFKKVFLSMLSKCQPIAPKHKFRFKNPVFSLDATTIDLCLSIFDWAKFRKTKGAVKLHVKLNHSGYLPNFVTMTTGKVHEQRVAPMVPFEKGDVVVFDRGYSSFEWFASLCERGCYFVTRLKRNAAYRIIERRDVSAHPNILSDHTVEFKGFYSHKKLPYRLRVVHAVDPETGKRIKILTNHMTWSARTIAAIYKERWQIEIFFKTIKQQLQIKSFVGTSKNALLSQLWIAMIAYLLLSYLKFKSKFNWSLYTLSSILPTNLFARRSLWDWLNKPYHASRCEPPGIKHPEFTFG
jgi:hypothetical protein